MGGLNSKIVVWVEGLIVLKIFDFNYLSEEFGGGEVLLPEVLGLGYSQNSHKTLPKYRFLRI